MTDPLLNKNFFTLLYWDGIKQQHLEIPITKWIPPQKGGIIPWHRVYFIKFNGNIIWDREKRICEINSCILDEKIETLPTEFTIMTFNVLSDIYEKQFTNIKKRMNDIINYISADIDVICLQEVQSELLEEIKTKIIPTGKYMSHTYVGVNDIVIITKINHTLVDIVNLSTSKCVPIISLNLENDMKLYIAGIHLTSDHHNDNTNKRSSQLLSIKNKLNELNATNCILLGDTNDANSNHKLSNFEDYVDTWIDIHNDAEGISYDPTANKLAGKISRSKSKYRLDRILYTKNNILRCTETNIDNTITFSDHYSVKSKFSVDCSDVVYEIKENDTEQLTNKTALCIIPPYDTWNKINNLKIGNYPQRWMPHINIFFGFVEEIYFYEIKKKIENINFDELGELEFNSIDYFKNQKTCTIFLKPSNDTLTKLRKLYNMIHHPSIIPSHCVNKTSTSNAFFPHISLGTIEWSNKVENFLKKRVNVTFQLTQLNIVSRLTTEYFKISKIINIVKLPHMFYVNFVKNIIENINVEFHVCGSRMYYGNVDNINDTSDTDVLCIGNIDRLIFFNTIVAIFETCGYFKNITIVKNSHICCLKICTNDNYIDLQYVNKNNTTDIYYNSGMALRSEPLYILEKMQDKIELFRECLTWFKNNLKKKNMYSALNCYIGGLSSSIIVCTIIYKKNVNTFDEFVEQLKIFDFDAPTMVGTYDVYKSSKPCDKLLYVGTSTIPIENTVRHICKSTAILLKEQFKIAFDDTLDPNIDRYIHKITFEIIATDDDKLNNAINWFNGCTERILIKIERRSPDAILCPSTSYDIHVKDDYISAIWTLQSSKEYTMINVIAEDIVEKSKKMFSDVYFTIK